MKGILGRKIGMTQVFSSDGKLVPVTVIEVNPNIVTQIKTTENDGYEAVQLGYEDVREKVSNKAKVGHTNKANTAPKRFLREIKGVDLAAYTLGQEVKADLFEAGEMVDVTGTSKGKGFQGVIKRHNQSRGPMGHGSQYHRGVGSLGTMRPMRVIPGKKMPGQMGNVRRTVQNLEVIEIDVENNLILIKGNVPGPKKGLVIIKSAVKNPESTGAKELVSYEEVVNEALEETIVEEENTTEEPVQEEETKEETPVEEENKEEVEETAEETEKEESGEEPSQETKEEKEEETSQE